MTSTDTPITDAAGLAGVASALGAHAAVGLDTEFMRERTYYAQLCLLQLAAPGVAVCVDTLAVTDLTPLRALAASPATTKIIHAARQDLEVLEPALGRVAPLFDTQVAAALCGFPAQVGYADLVREILGVDLHKSQTRTDWSRRPLTDAQIDYALDDVRHLDALRQALLGRLAQLGREAWLAEEMAALAEEPLATEPDRAWERLKGIRELDEHRQRVARRLAAWREEIARLFHGRPEWPTGQALLEPMKTYGLAREDFLALIDGMEMDAAGMCAPTLEELELYCDRVASAVGRLSIKAFGAGEPRARDVARHLGQALQLTNILRDLTEDAQRGRLYLPEELLTRHGVRSRDPAGALTEPGIAAVCDELAAMARARFAEARRAVADCASAPMRPAVVMLEVYRRILDRLCARGWRDLDRPVRLSKLTKLWIGLRYGLG